MNKPISLYIHIPFCRRKCSYCDFTSFAKPVEVQRAYIDSLIKEIDLWDEYISDKGVSTVFIGGGTPSILETQDLKRLLERISKLKLTDELEFSVECNPDSTDIEKLNIMRSYGVNRISFGLQSTREEELALLRRTHNYETFLRSYEAAGKAGFSNINVDLMFALPKQSIEHHLSSLEKVVALSPSHLSLYSLIVEENTLMKRWIDEKKLVLPSEDEYVDMYRRTIHYLKRNGFVQYEISNFSKPGYECIHNKRYWDRSEYLGLGISSASFLENRRYTSTDVLDEFLTSLRWTPEALHKIEPLSKEEVFEETIFLGMRLNEGLSLDFLREKFHEFITDSFYSTLDSLEKRNLIIRNDREIIALTQKGIEISNQVFLELLL